MGFQRNLIYLDETGFQISTLRNNHGRAVAGETPTLSVLSKKKRLNCIAALSIKGIEHLKFISSTLQRKENNGGQGGVNAEDFRGFLLDLAPKIPRNSLLIMDNAKIHHANLLDNTVWGMLKTQYGLEKLYLSPYSPFLNPIEYIFNTVKRSLGKNQSIVLTKCKRQSKRRFSKSLQFKHQTLLSTAKNTTKWQGIVSHLTEKFYHQLSLLNMMKLAIFNKKINLSNKFEFKIIRDFLFI